MEKKSFKDFVTHIKESLQGGLETARSEGIPKKIAAIVFGTLSRICSASESAGRIIQCDIPVCESAFTFYRCCNRRRQLLIHAS